jgi:hypothetical protein
VDRERAFDTFSGHDAADGEVFIDSFAAHRNDDTGKHLHAFLVAFLNQGVHVDGVPDFKLGFIVPETVLGDVIENFLLIHGKPRAYRTFREVRQYRSFWENVNSANVGIHPEMVATDETRIEHR